MSRRIRRAALGDRPAQPAFSAFGRLVLSLPLLAISLLFVAVAFIGVAKLPGAEQSAMPAAYARAAMTALMCLGLAIPAGAMRPTMAWLVPLVGTQAAGAAGWALLPVPGGALASQVEGAILLSPVMVMVLGTSWRRIPREPALAAKQAGASRIWIFWNLILGAALPGIAYGLALVFVLAVGIAPLLAPSQGNP